MNWTKIIDELRQRGYTMVDIARAIGVEPTTIQAIRGGRNQNPQWPTGDALIRLYKKAMRKYPRIDDAA